MLAPATRAQVRRLNDRIRALENGILEEAKRCERVADALDSGAGYGPTRGARQRSTAARLRALVENKE